MDVLINTFVVLFIVVDPIGMAPIFAALTRDAPRERQRAMAIRGTALAAAILFVFFLAGNRLLDALQIGLPAFRIAGGCLLFLLAIDMIFARQSGLRSTTVEEQLEAEHKRDVSVFPLAFPLIAGPGALTTVLLMASSWSGMGTFLAMLAVLTVVLGLSLLSLLFAPAIMRMLGETGANVISRLFGLILAALAVQYVIDGIKAAF
ncbi:MAG: NAAT family transporter [Gammaproteobacteria bacterium]|nr:NAAT family transporter [Gammaproteobacteria bacterium]